MTHKLLDASCEERPQLVVEALLLGGVEGWKLALEVAHPPRIRHVRAGGKGSRCPRPDLPEALDLAVLVLDLLVIGLGASRPRVRRW